MNRPPEDALNRNNPACNQSEADEDLFSFTLQSVKWSIYNPLKEDSGVNLAGRRSVWNVALNGIAAPFSLAESTVNCQPGNSLSFHQRNPSSLPASEYK